MDIVDLLSGDRREDDDITQIDEEALLADSAFDDVQRTMRGSKSVP